MIFPKLTAYYAGLFAIILVFLSVRVTAGRVKARVHHGHGGVDRLDRIIRAQANFTEYVPLSLIMVGLLEAGGAPEMQVHFLLGPLLLSRLMHPIGMMAPVASAQQYGLRGVSAFVTWGVMLAAAALLLVRPL
jgi:uncharacterized membrane protein YecN with MAPEG domain